MSQSILFIGRKNEQFIDPSVNECYRILGPAAGIIFDVDVVALLPSSSLSILCVKASRQKTYSNCDANVINKIEAVLKVKVIYSFRDTHLTDLWSGHFADTSNLPAPKVLCKSHMHYICTDIANYQGTSTSKATRPHNRKASASYLILLSFFYFPEKKIQ